ncbi:MAG: amidohydrolase family protein [Candidatus Brocadiia bacterium]
MTKNEIMQDVCAQEGLIDVHTHVGIDPVSFLNGDFPYALSAEDLVFRMDAQNIDYAVCFPFIYTSYFQLHSFANGEFEHDPENPSSFPYEVENRRLCREIYDAFPQFAGRVLPFLFFDPGRQTEAQVSLLNDLCQEYPLFGLKTATSYLQSHISELNNEGSCLLDLAAERNLPMTIHSAVMPGDPWANVFEILDVVKSHPEVRFSVAHTCRFDRSALETAAGLRNCYVDFSAFHIHCKLAEQNHPAVAVEEERFPTDYREHAVAMQQIAEAYPDTMMWGTDTPAYYFISRFFNDKGKEIEMSLPCAPWTEIREFRKLPEDLRRKIAYENTIRFLFG